MYYFYYFYFSSMPTSSKRTQFDLCNTTVLPVCAQNQLHRKMQFDGERTAAETSTQNDSGC